MSRLEALEALIGDLRQRIERLEEWTGRMPVPVIWPGELERARLGAGLTMQQAAGVCSVATSTWCRWESGEHRCAGDMALMVVAEFAAAGLEPPTAVE